MIREEASQEDDDNDPQADQDFAQDSRETAGWCLFNLSLWG
jgi:hypothetical protein